MRRTVDVKTGSIPVSVKGEELVVSNVPNIKSPLLSLSLPIVSVLCVSA